MQRVQIHLRKRIPECITPQRLNTRDASIFPLLPPHPNAITEPVLLPLPDKPFATRITKGFTVVMLGVDACFTPS
jgi:hypothetical protein